MKLWKRIGWLALGITPVTAVFIWQTLVSTVGIMVYAVYIRLQTGDMLEGDGAYEQMLADFTSGQSYNILMFVVYIGYLIIFGLWYWLMYVRREKTGAGKQVLKPHRIVGIIGCGIATQIAISMLLTVLLPLFPTVQDNYMQIMSTLGNESIFMVICVCILAPIGEELIFRGLTFRIFRNALPWQAAWIIQAIAFGVYHLNLVQGIYATVLGLILGYTAYRYGSVIPGILLHMAINSSSYLISYLLPAELENQVWMQLVLGGIGILAGIGFSVLYLKGVNPKNSIKEADS